MKELIKCVDDSLAALGCMEHRGACSADNDSGDGAGIRRKFRGSCYQSGVMRTVSPAFRKETSAVSMTLLPNDAGKRSKAKAEIEKAIVAEGLKVLGWREVPTKNEIVGPMAKITQPTIEQCLIDGAGVTGDELERKLYFARKNAEKALAPEIWMTWKTCMCAPCPAEPSCTRYVEICCRRTVLPRFARQELRLVVLHLSRRFSTNTIKWR